MILKSKICNFGWKAKSFNLLSIDNKYYTLDELKGNNGTLIMFICNHCPYVKAIIEKIRFESLELKNMGINSIAVMSNDVDEYPEDSFENMKIFFDKNQLNFPYLYDFDQTVAKTYNAQCTPDFYGFNKNLELQYRGRIDSSGMNNRKNSKRDLYNAMKNIMLNGKGPENQIPSMGCSIKWKK